MSWKDTTRVKREQILSSIPAEWRFAVDEVGGRTKQRNIIDLVAKRLSATDREITELPVQRLLQKLQQGDVTAREVLVCPSYWLSCRSRLSLVG